jgi:hypothetical protein
MRKRRAGASFRERILEIRASIAANPWPCPRREGKGEAKGGHRSTIARLQPPRPVAPLAAAFYRRIFITQFREKPVPVCFVKQRADFTGVRY